MKKQITGPWKLEDLKTIKANGLKVFSCFHCGGGSSMGYKLAGFEVLGGVEIDPQMMRIYKKNHNPKHSYLMGVEEFNKIPNDKIPIGLFDIDILDGSPPCSSFSMAGSREDAWGEKKKFREGQAEQVLDELFFHFIATAKKLMPKVVVAENVKGLIQGNAKGYVKEIFEQFYAAGYIAQLFLLNASRMGVPQARERTVFIARRRDMGLPKLELAFNEPLVTAGEALNGVVPSEIRELSPAAAKLWPTTIAGDPLSKSKESKGNFFSWRKLHPSKVATTVTATHCMMHWKEPRLLSSSEIVRLQTFPDDYNFMDADGPYVCGMSVPPFMINRIAQKIYEQWFEQN